MPSEFDLTPLSAPRQQHAGRAGLPVVRRQLSGRPGCVASERHFPGRFADCPACGLPARCADTDVRGRTLDLRVEMGGDSGAHRHGDAVWTARRRWRNRLLEGDETRTAQIAVAGPRLWSAEEPNLYTLLLTLADAEGRTPDRRAVPGRLPADRDRARAAARQRRSRSRSKASTGTTPTPTSATSPRASICAGTSR